MHRTRIRRRTKSRQAMAAALMLAAMVGGVVCAWQFGDRIVGLLDPMQRASAVPVPRQPASAPVVQKAQLLLQRRPVYPYSVISGGVESAGELKIAMRFDPVVAAHYADFDLSRTRVERLTANRAVYVSFRSGDRVGWTSRRLTLRTGETILTDGQNAARTRCGNRITDVPPPKVVVDEPAPEVLETPVLPTIPIDLVAGFDTLVSLGEIPVPQQPIPTPPPAPLVDYPGPNVLGFPPLYWTPPGLIVVPPEGPTPPPPPPEPIPEPATLLLVLPAFGIYPWVRRLRRR
jgi:hypothetical protein